MTKSATLKISPVDMAFRAKLDMRPGTTVRVHQKIKEKGKTRLQIFEGLIISRKHNTEPGATFTVRKVASGVGMEKIFPLYSPMIDKIEIVRRSKTRRAKLYYIREKAAKEVRRRMKQLSVEARIKREEQETTAQVMATAEENQKSKINDELTNNTEDKNDQLTKILPIKIKTDKPAKMSSNKIQADQKESKIEMAEEKK